MATIESILENIGSEPSVNGLINAEKSSIRFDFESYHTVVEEKTHGDDMFIVPRADIKEHRIAIPPSSGKLRGKILELTI